MLPTSTIATSTCGLTTGAGPKKTRSGKTCSARVRTPATRGRQHETRRTLRRLQLLGLGRIRTAPPRAMAGGRSLYRRSRSGAAGTQLCLCQRQVYAEDDPRGKPSDQEIIGISDVCLTNRRKSRKVKRSCRNFQQLLLWITGYFLWVNGKEIQDCHHAIYMTSTMCHHKSLKKI